MVKSLFHGFGLLAAAVLLGGAMHFSLPTANCAVAATDLSALRGLANCEFGEPKKVNCGDWKLDCPTASPCTAVCWSCPNVNGYTQLCQSVRPLIYKCCKLIDFDGRNGQFPVSCGAKSVGTCDANSCACGNKQNNGDCRKQEAINTGKDTDGACTKVP